MRLSLLGAATALAAALIGAVPAMAGADPVDPPDLAIDPPAAVTVAHGQSGSFDLSISNDASDQATPAKITITLPSGLSFAAHPLSDDDSGKSLACVTAGRRTTCTDTIDGLTSVTGVVQAAPGLAIGTHLSIPARVDPATGRDADPGNNAASVPVTVLGAARLVLTEAVPQQHLSVTGAGAHAAIPVGQPIRFAVSVTNRGPDPAPNTSVRVGTLAPPGPAFVITRGDGHPFAVGANVIVLHLGTIRPGQTITRTFIITGHRVGATTLFGVTLDGTGVAVLGHECDSRSCDFASSILFRTVAGRSTVPVTLNPPRVHPVPELAATGVGVVPDLGAGLALLALGGALALGARRRRRVDG